jgi:putative transposase
LATSGLIGKWLKQQPDVCLPSGPLHNKPRFWQHESYDRIVRDIEELIAFRRYIARNPEIAKLRPGEFIYYAAGWLDEFAERPALPVSA